MSRLSTFLSIFLLITTTSVVLTYAQKVEPTIDPEPINLQYKAMLYRLDFKTIPTISPAMRSVLLLTTLYYIIVFGKVILHLKLEKLLLIWLWIGLIHILLLLHIILI